MLQREPLMKELHVDAYYETTDYYRHKSTVYRLWAKYSPYDPKVRVVDDRIVNIIPRGVLITKGKAWKLQQEFYVSVDDPQIGAEFVYLDKIFDDHGAARQHKRNGPKGEDGKDPFRGGVHSWTKICLPLDKAALQNHEIVTTADGEKHYRLEADVVIRALEDDLNICFDIMKPKPNEAFVAFRVEDQIWSGDHSEFAQL